MGKTILTVILAVVVILAVGCGGSGGEYSEAEAVKVEATRQAVALEATRTVLDLEKQAFELERARVRAEAIDPLLMTLPWVVLAVGLGAFVVVGLQWLPILTARLGLVRRRPQEGEPVWLMGKNRFALPLRSGNVYADLTQGAERSPLLAANAEVQERAVMRQQAANLTLASQAAEVVKALRGGGDVNLVLPPEKREPAPALAAPSPVRVLQEPTPMVAGWIEDVKKPLLLEVTDDD